MSKITKVLLVEDEEDAREILGFYLDTIFDEVQIACDGQEGLDKFLQKKEKEEYFDVIVTDIQMPRKDGMTMIEEIASIEENQKFIIVSAHKDEEFLFRSINLNVMGYFVKPLVVENIMQLLKKVKKSILEKAETIQNKEVEIKQVKINDTFNYDKDKRLLYEADTMVNLSKKETLLLDAMIKRKNEINTIETLKMEVWNNTNISDATLRTAIKRLKDKIAKDDFIVSKKGLGYIIE
ncbi:MULTISPECIES: response regulator transcription factor [Arcobacteraceae]|uniref:Transcriptional regulator n=1 Tax=Poseidonibacter parvus TaxID=1850254 RepID=A0A1P8KLY0_9BACT|nr:MULTISPECIES: response regulator transcription factor [Arcobacteraceae]APW65573.1 transcriptional regulator [Poseidonibacter parvus]